MAITYSWNVAALECVPHEDGLTNIVKTVHWIRLAKDGAYETSSYGSVAIPAPTSPGNFIPYEDLAEDDVEAWLDTYVDVDATDAALANQIAALKNPPVVTPPLPWNNLPGN